MKPRTKRAVAIAGGLAALGVAAALVLNAFQSNLVFFFTPTQVAKNEVPKDRTFRMGGLVEPGSLVRQKDALTVNFKITDGAQSIPVIYTGILPDLFKEGQGTIVRGKFDDNGLFVAEEVLAKHDENYMPPEVKDSLKGHMDAANNTPGNTATPPSPAPGST